MGNKKSGIFKDHNKPTQNDQTTFVLPPSRHRQL